MRYSWTSHITTINIYNFFHKHKGRGVEREENQNCQLMHNKNKFMIIFECINCNIIFVVIAHAYKNPAKIFKFSRSLCESPFIAHKHTTHERKISFSFFNLFNESIRRVIFQHTILSIDEKNVKRICFNQRKNISTKQNIKKRRKIYKFCSHVLYIPDS